MESTTHQIFVTSKLRTKYPDYFTNSTNQKYVSILAVHLFKDDNMEENPDSAADHVVVDPNLSPAEKAAKIMDEVKVGVNDFDTVFTEEYRTLLESAVTHLRIPQDSMIIVSHEEQNPNPPMHVYQLSCSEKLLPGSVIRCFDGMNYHLWILDEDDVLWPNEGPTGSFFKESEDGSYIYMVGTMNWAIDESKPIQLWGFYDAPVETDEAANADSTFSILQYCQLHADFVQDDECLEQYVCMANLPLYHKRKYKQYNNPRYFNVWFTDYKGTKININELDPKNPYHFVVELLLEY